MTRQKESEVQGFFRMGVFKWGNDGKINDFKRIIGPGWGRKKEANHVSTDTPQIKKLKKTMSSHQCFSKL